MVKTSIIVPVYNTAEYLWDCFESIFGQTQREIEIIAINDGSTDNSLDILYDIKKKYPELIIFSQKNKCQGAARNKGMELATGEFVYFMDSDDCIVPTAMETCYQYADTNRLDFLMFDAEIFGDIEGKKNCYDRKHLVTEQECVLSGIEYAVENWNRIFLVSPCLVYLSMKFMRKNHIRFLSDVYYEDNEFHCKIMLLAERVMYIPRILYRRRYREGSTMTSPYGLRNAYDMLQVLKAIIKLPRKNEVKKIMHSMERRLMWGLLHKCEREDLLSNRELLQKIYDMTLLVCGGNMEKIESVQDVELLYWIGNVPKQECLSEDNRQVLEKRRRNIICSMFGKLGLNENHRIGIYGTGKDTNRFLTEYRKNVGAIRADLIFIDSYVQTKTEKYEGYDVYNINDIGDFPLDSVIIASSKYEEQMCSIMQEKYGDRFKLVCLRKDLDF